MSTEEANDILEDDGIHCNVHQVNSFKEACELYDNEYDEFRDKSTGKVNCILDSCRLDIGELYLFYPPAGVFTSSQFFALVLNKKL